MFDLASNNTGYRVAYRVTTAGLNQENPILDPLAEQHLNKQLQMTCFWEWCVF